MAVNFNAEQYEKEFKANRIQNWEIPKQYKGKVNSLLNLFLFWYAFVLKLFFYLEPQNIIWIYSIRCKQ